MRDRTKGLLIILSGVLCVSPDAVLVRFLSEGGTDPWCVFFRFILNMLGSIPVHGVQNCGFLFLEGKGSLVGFGAGVFVSQLYLSSATSFRTIIFWKLLLSIPVSASYAVYEAGGIKALWESVVVGRWYYVAAIPIQASVDICFTLAFVYTSAANALLLINLNPLWCAVAGRIFLGDALPKRTYIALLLALCCMLVIFVPEVIERRSNEDVANGSDQGQTSVAGNVIALFCGFLLAAYITIVRKGGMSSKNINLIGAAALGASLSSIISLAVRRGDVLPSSYWTDELWKYWVGVAAQGFGIGAVFVAMSVAPKLISGAEIGMVVLLEAILGPLFVFLAYGDTPSKWTLIGGSLLLVVLVVHESGPLFEKAKEVHRSLSRKMSSRLGSTIGTGVELKPVNIVESPEKEGELGPANEEGVVPGANAKCSDTRDATNACRLMGSSRYMQQDVISYK